MHESDRDTKIHGHTNLLCSTSMKKLQKFEGLQIYNPFLFSIGIHHKYHQTFYKHDTALYLYKEKF